MSRFSELKAQGRFTRFPTPRSWGHRALNGGDVPPKLLQEEPLAEGLVFTFYTYADARIPLDERWKQTGLRDIFFVCGVPAPWVFRLQRSDGDIGRQMSSPNSTWRAHCEALARAA